MDRGKMVRTYKTQKFSSYSSLTELFWDLVPTYRSHVWKGFVCRYRWSSSISEAMWGISRMRCEKRIRSYIDETELVRARAAIQRTGECALRFGREKEGAGLYGGPKDFCLVGGAMDQTCLWVFYRKLELIGGLHFDQVIYDYTIRSLGRTTIRWIGIMATEARTIALKGNSSEKLWDILAKGVHRHDD